MQNNTSIASAGQYVRNKKMDLVIRSHLASKAESTQIRYEKHIQQYLAYVVQVEKIEGLEVDADTVSRYLTFLTAPKIGPDGEIEPVGPSIVAQAIGCIKGLYRELKNAGYIEKNPWALQKTALTKKDIQVRATNVRERAFTPAEMKIILDVAEDLDGDDDLSHQNLINWFYATGLRVSELANAKFSDIKKTKNGYVLEVLGKGNKLALIPLSQKILQWADDYKNFLRSRSGNLKYKPKYLVESFMWNASKIIPMSKRSIQERVKKIFDTIRDDPKYAKKFGGSLDEASCHSFRHTFITHLIDKKVDPVLVKNLARHASFDMTMLYVSADQEKMHNAVSLL